MRMETLGYRLMDGRQGAWGCICTRDGAQHLSAQGLQPGADYTLYCLDSGKRLARVTADRDGGVRWSGGLPDAAFLGLEEQVILWERGEEGFCRASGILRDARAASPRNGSEAPESREESGEEETEKEPRETQPPENSSDGARQGSEPAPAETILLRAPGTGRPVDSLPALAWPWGTEKMRRLIRSCPPVAPFDAPGWRFVRTPPRRLFRRQRTACWAIACGRIG